jgi:hypothetical protein
VAGMTSAVFRNQMGGKKKMKVQKKLKRKIEPVHFLKAVNRCKGEVVLTTLEGDCLNLKSTLSRYIFAVNVEQKEFPKSEVCFEEGDYDFIREYLI